ncbi:MAG: hypothetical protein ACOY3N_23335 [Bradyrhizobium sp.]|uniref:hypothetical protein n=1 Tax=Bradyrhizobium sp. TaxID=376 RepID=UPI003BF457C6
MSKGKRVVDALIRLVILSGVMLGADVLALVLFLLGASAPVIIGAMGVCGVIGIALGLRATTPLAGPSPPPAPYGPSAPRKLASRKTGILG